MLTTPTRHPPVFPFTHPALYEREPCCFRCSMRTLHTHVAHMIGNLPPGAWETAVKPRIVLPLLRRLSTLDPLRRMPLRWLEQGGEAHPEHCPAGGGAEGGGVHDFSTQVVIKYWEMCRMAKVGPKGSHDKQVFFKTLLGLISSVLYTIAAREKHSVAMKSFLALEQQISILNGWDSIYEEIKDVITRSSQWLAHDITRVAKNIARCGAVDYALFVVERRRRSFESNEAAAVALDQLRDALLAGRANEAAKIRALLMALHPRSTGAAIRALGPDLLRVCVRAVPVERIVLWEEVLVEWLAVEMGVGAHHLFA